MSRAWKNRKSGVSRIFVVIIIVTIVLLVVIGDVVYADSKLSSLNISQQTSHSSTNTRLATTITNYSSITHVSSTTITRKTTATVTVSVTVTTTQAGGGGNPPPPGHNH